MSRIEKLYEAMILEHNKHPRHFGKIQPFTCYSHGYNPLCGDDYEIYIHLNDQGCIENIGFHGSGCAISKSSASLMTESVLGKSKVDALCLSGYFLQMLTTEEVKRESLGKLLVFENVKNFPARVKCAALIWRAFEDAMSEHAQKNTVSTE
jgi:nitrogen fixation NifU-like protein